MDRLGKMLEMVVHGENCLKHIASIYVEEDDGENSSGEEDGVESSAEAGHGSEGRHGLGESVGMEGRDDGVNDENRTEECGGSFDGVHGGGSSEERDDGAVGGGEEMHGGGNIAENGFVQHGDRHNGMTAGGERHSGAAEGARVEGEKRGCAGGAEDGVELGEKSLSNSDCDGESGEVQDGPAVRRKRGRPSKSGEWKANMRAAPKVEEPRAVRMNRGVKRRFPGDDSEDDSLPKRVRVRSIAAVCGDYSEPMKGEDVSMDEAVEGGSARKRGRCRKGTTFEGIVEVGETEVSALASCGKRKTMEAVLDSGSTKRPRHGRNGAIFACNVKGCKKRFVEAASLYAHARVHGDRPYVCHYEGCVKSFSERSKLKRHFLIHTGEKPFLCQYEGCGKAFSLDFNLRSHMKTHTGDYHECPYDRCDKRYCQEYKLRAHILKEHKKCSKVTKKSMKVVGTGVSGPNMGDAGGSKKREVLAGLQTRRSKLQSMKEARLSRIAELEAEKQREGSELGRIERSLRKLEREQRRVEEGQAVRGVTSVSGSEEVDGENGDEGEEACPSNRNGGDTRSSVEHESRLEITAMEEGKDVVMFAHKLPTADQGARLVGTMDAKRAESQQEAGTSLMPTLWVQGARLFQGHVGDHSALRPHVNSRCPAGAEVAKSGSACGRRSCGGKEMGVQLRRGNGEGCLQGESSDSGAGRGNGGAGKVGWGLAEGGSGKARVSGTKKSLGAASRGGVGQMDASVVVRGKVVRCSAGEKGKRERELARVAKQHAGGGVRSSETFVVSMNPILLSSEHGFSPTDARFMAKEGFPSLAQGLVREQLGGKDGGESTSGRVCPPKEKAYRSMNEVLHSAAGQDGFVGGGGSEEGFARGQVPAEQSFEDSAAQLFTYHEQPRLVD
ncbi:uncharacterized protein [Physcomitrium patens]|uniref:uncharacterized protein isoform X3 n=1 Tax=Physcomitrium patens TaxID=3218 RepID=UPI000D169553|nr:uncharacterized protein LOC112281361 isoform X1 [Physcomitrium patens]XP_024373547.1 uncharacterized protein LOC112281361 isoform X1 [Physcomitrium patens]XP_024373548.1 uncharacterized protein LOC112281361 isoform X1 [Physcomitrium patens]XP_024373549.1 uncharacterized protein LOC112281361 isoform X1 [Physcomitrium patens]|eukprot:XP_024373546.1 uncharacterized protein LOC112281361 isoform X1 [Physcomitrella patens]